MKRPQTWFHADTMTGSKVIRLKNFKFTIRTKVIVRSKFVTAVFSFDRDFIKVTTRDADMHLQV